MSDKKPILKVNNLSQYFSIPKSNKNKSFFEKIFGGTFDLKAVDNITFEINEGEVFGLVGESGSGKSTTGRSIIRLYNPTKGDVMFDGKDISKKLSKKDKLQLAREMQMIFQDPYASVNPRLTVEEIIGEGIRIHQPEYSREERKKKIIELLEKVGLSETHISRYPHEFSGGQLQRIGIARALAVKPKLIIADEAISALDVSIQAQVVNLMRDLQKDFGLTYLFIAHDLSMVKYISDRIGVMHKGKLVEVGTSDEIYNNPIHPYTKSLLSAIPQSDPEFEKTRVRIKYNPSIHQYSEKNQPKFHQISETQRVLCTDQELEAFLKDEVQIYENGNLVEQAKTSEIFEFPLHPYTRKLLGKEVIKVKTAQELLNQLPERIGKIDILLPQISVTVDHSIKNANKEIIDLSSSSKKEYEKFYKEFKKILNNANKKGAAIKPEILDKNLYKLDKLKTKLMATLENIESSRNNYDEDLDTQTIIIIESLISELNKFNTNIDQLISEVSVFKENSADREINSSNKIQDKLLYTFNSFDSKFGVIVNNVITKVKTINDSLPIDTKEEQQILESINNINKRITDYYIPRLTELNNKITSESSKKSNHETDVLQKLLIEIQEEIVMYNLNEIKKKHLDNEITQVSEVIKQEYKIINAVINTIKYLQEYSVEKTQQNQVQQITDTHVVYSTELEKDILVDIYNNTIK